jgi:phytoene synthase
MSASLIDTLPLPQRLALTYAPGKARNETLALFAFDARLGQALRQANEPIMAQMRLAWWRDQLKLEPLARERSDELVRALDLLDTQRHALSALVDGWELLLTENFDVTAASAFVSARAQALLGLARVVKAPDPPENVLLAGQSWALADLVASLGSSAEREEAMSVTPPRQARRLSRRMRPLAVLDTLAQRSLAAGGNGLLGSPGSAFLAMRVGLFGR